MKTIFRKVLLKDGLPQKEGAYFCDGGHLWFNITTKKWNSNVNSNVLPEWWLEEIELPSDDEIIKMYPERNSSGTYLDMNIGRREGAKDIRNLVLAATPK